MSGPRGFVLDGEERLRRAVAELPDEEREAAAARLGGNRGRTPGSEYRDWLDDRLPTTLARWLRLLHGAAGDRRLYLRAVRSGRGAGRGTHGEGR